MSKVPMPEPVPPPRKFHELCASGFGQLRVCVGCEGSVVLFEVISNKKKTEKAKVTILGMHWGAANATLTHDEIKTIAQQTFSKQEKEKTKESAKFQQSFSLSANKAIVQQTSSKHKQNTKRRHKNKKNE